MNKNNNPKMKKTLFSLVFMLYSAFYGEAQITFVKTYAGPDSPAHSVQQTSDSGFIVVGGTDAFGAGDLDIYLVKTDAYGDAQWAKTFGGSDFDLGYSVRQTFD